VADVGNGKTSHAAIVSEESRHDVPRAADASEERHIE
jgi:hypothetical protein